MRAAFFPAGGGIHETPGDAPHGMDGGQSQLLAQRLGSGHVLPGEGEPDWGLVPRFEGQVQAERKPGVGEVGGETRVFPDLLRQ